MTAITKPLISLGPKLDEFLRRRPMTPEQAATARLLDAAGVTGLERNADGLIDLGPDGDDNGGRLLGTLRDRNICTPLCAGGMWVAVPLRGKAEYAETLAHVAALAWLEDQ